MFKFSIEREPLLTAMLLVVGAVEKRNTLPVLSNVLMDVSEDGLTLAGTDTEIELKSHIPVKSVEKQGKTTIPARKIIDICRSLNDGVDINFSTKEDRVLISCGRSRFNLTSISADDYPCAPDELPELEFQIETKALIELLQVSHFCMAQQDVRFYLNGLLLESVGQKLFSVSTDGHRLALASISLDSPLPESKLILPRKGVLELLRLLNDIEDESVLIKQTVNHFYLITKKHQFVSKLIIAKFPNHQRVIPVDNDKQLLVDRDLLKKTLLRVSILANEKYRAVTLAISHCKLTIDAVNQEQEQAIEELEVDTQGEPISIGINATYLIDVLNNIPPGLVKLSFSEPNKSILLESVALPIAKYIIMPIKI